jgi:hypothetical protein
MPLSPSGKKMMESFKSRYGEKQGTSYFYATLNKRPSIKKKVEGVKKGA